MIYLSMSSCQDVKKEPKINEIRDKDQIQKEELDLILETLENMTNKLNSSVGGIKNAVSEVDHKVRKGDTRFSGLANEIVTSIQNLQDGIIYEMKRKKGKCPAKDQRPYCLLMEDRVMCEALSNLYLCIGNKIKLTKVEVIKEIRKKIDDLDKTMDKQLKEVVTALQETVKNSQRHGDNQDKLRKNVQKRFYEHEEFIRTNFLELILGRSIIFKKTCLLSDLLIKTFTEGTSCPFSYLELLSILQLKIRKTIQIFSLSICKPGPNFYEILKGVLVFILVIKTGFGPKGIT